MRHCKHDYDSNDDSKVVISTQYLDSRVYEVEFLGGEITKYTTCVYSVTICQERWVDIEYSVKDDSVDGNNKK